MLQLQINKKISRHRQLQINEASKRCRIRKKEQIRYANQSLMPTTKPKVNVIFGDIPQKSAFNLKSPSSASPSVPSFSVVHPNSESRRQILAILGVK